MQRQQSNVGNFVFQHQPQQQPQHTAQDSEPDTAEPGAKVTAARRATARLSRAPLNYSQEDIHALASQAELLVLTRGGSSSDLRRGSSSSAGDGDTDTMSKVSLGSSSSSVHSGHSGHSGPYSLDLDTIAGDSEEPCLSGTWEHDIQEQYVSEGSVLAAWDNSMKSVLCFGEDYSNYIRRKSELPSLDIISSDICGLQASPRHLRAGDVDPVILLRMSERDWLAVVSELNTEHEQETSFGDVDNYDRLIQTCGVNLDTLQKLNISADVAPKCLPQDHGDLIGTWEELLTELKQKLDQCLAFNGINKEIEIISLKVESISSQKAKLESLEENDAISYKENLKKLLDNLDLVRPELETTKTDIHNLHTRVAEDKHVQKISLMCFCKQEATSLSDRLDLIFDQVTKIIDDCNQAIEEKRELDKEVTAIEKYFSKNRWIPSRVTPASPPPPQCDPEQLDRLHRSLGDLKSRRMITSEFFRKCTNILNRAEQSLTEGESPEEGGAGAGLLFSCMPVMLVTSALMVYNYCSPASLLQKLCRFYHVPDSN